jgi:ATP-dependent Clp protease adaptor protein ClpS
MMLLNMGATRWQEAEEILLETAQEEQRHLIVWNDDVNTFDHVIESLMNVCEHSPEQAEQCALLVHYKGKCSVKRGGFDDLRPRCEALIDRGINATIE